MFPKYLYKACVPEKEDIWERLPLICQSVSAGENALRTASEEYPSHPTAFAKGKITKL